MENFAKLLTAIAALLGAIAWPTLFIVVVLVFRSELRAIVAKIPPFLDRLKKASLAGVAVELERIADAEVESGTNKGGKITPRQLEAAARIQTQDVGADTLLRELDRLCLEYDSIRRALPPGNDRTRAMTRVIVKMRSLALSVVDYIEAYKGSGSAGSRLAAVAMMQMVPRAADLEWLKDRFSSEHPFIFYHAALALQIVADTYFTSEQRARVRKAAQQALATVKGFDGTPDQATIEVLETLISSLPK